MLRHHRGLSLAADQGDLIVVPPAQGGSGDGHASEIPSLRPMRTKYRDRQRLPASFVLELCYHFLT